MASNDRFYQLELRHRAALHGDIGSLLKIEGVVVGGEGARGIFMLPDASLYPNNEIQGETVLMAHAQNLTPEQWSDWLQRSDNPEILVNGGLEKAFHRKLRYDISGHVQQKVWAADGSKCMYCFRKMGEVQLTIDHFIPLEMGGKNDPTNYLSACRRCNMAKGGMMPEAFCQIPNRTKWTFGDYTGYLQNRTLR